MSKAIYSGDWELYPRKDGTLCLQDFTAEVPRRVVLTDAEALEVWRVLNKWVERKRRKGEVRRSCGICKYFVLRLSHTPYCTVHIATPVDVDHIPEWCNDFRLPRNAEAE